PGRAGAGMVHTIVWRVESPEAVSFWDERLTSEGVPVARDGDRLRFADPEGLTFELTVEDTSDAPLMAEHPEVPQELALQGFAGVRAYSIAPEASAPLLGRVLGAERRGDSGWELRGDSRGSFIAYDTPPAQRGAQSAGTVHHVAWGTNVAEHPRWDAHLREAGVHTSGIIDRHYFHSIYFREPSGVLFEIADDGPGFTVDVPLDQLGSVVILPPRFEPHRAAIEARLTPLPDPRADWPVAQ
ncbi:MAG: Glyoxalase family protein, partial [uncultured Solirubrobacteraceae bacterium]